MGSLVFQATLGGQVNLNGPNTASTFDIAVPATTGTMVTTGDTGTVTNTMLAASAYNTPGTIGSGTANTGAFTTLSASSTISGTGFSTYLASPPAIGGTAAAAGTFTTLSGTTSVTTPIVKSASSLTLQSNGTTTAVTVDTSQNVGIGTASPSQKLQVANGNIYISTTNYLMWNSGGSYAIDSDASTRLSFYAGSGTERMRIDSSGNVGIGTTTIGQKLVIESNSGQLRLRNSTTRYRSDYTVDSSGNMEINSYDDTASAYKQIKLNGSPLVFAVGSEAMRIDSSGNVLVGAASGGGKLSVTGTGSSGWVQNNINSGTASTASIVFTNGNGVVGSILTSGSATTYSTSSDYRLKEDVAPMTGALATVALLKPVTYKWKIDGTAGQGFIAHELQAVVPDCVGGEKDAVDEDGNPQYQGVDTSFLVATLTAAIQEQQALIISLTARIAALEAK